MLSYQQAERGVPIKGGESSICLVKTTIKEITVIDVSKDKIDCYPGYSSNSQMCRIFLQV